MQHFRCFRRNLAAHHRRGRRRAVVQQHAPAAAAALVDVGRNHDGARALALPAAHQDVFVQAVHREHQAGDRDQIAQMHLQALAGLENLRPVFAHLRKAGEPRAAGMDAAHLFVLGPDFHHRVQIGALQRLVEGSLRVLRRGKVGLFQNAAPRGADATACRCCVAQRKAQIIGSPRARGKRIATGAPALNSLHPGVFAARHPATVMAGYRRSLVAAFASARSRRRERS
jgi:hypothetical protein